MMNFGKFLVGFGLILIFLYIRDLSQIFNYHGPNLSLIDGISIGNKNFGSFSHILVFIIGSISVFFGIKLSRKKAVLDHDPKGRGNSLPGGSGDNGAQDTAGTAEARPVQREHRFAGMAPGDIYTNDEGVPTTLSKDVLDRETKPHLTGDAFHEFPYAADRLRLAIGHGYKLAPHRLAGHYFHDDEVFLMIMLRRPDGLSKLLLMAN